MGDETSIAELKLRYANGAITRKAYEQAMKELSLGKSAHQPEAHPIQKEIKSFETKLKKEEKIYFGKFRPRFFIIVGIVLVIALYLTYSALTPSYINSSQLSSSDLAVNSKSVLYVPFQVISNLGTNTDCSHAQASSDIGSVSVAVSDSGCVVAFTSLPLATTQYAHITLSDGQLTKEFTVKVNPVQTARISLSPSSISSPADGSTLTTINVTAFDNSSSSVPDGTVITLSLTGSAGGSLSPTTCSTISGMCKISYKASTTAGNGTIEASSYTATDFVQVILTQLPPSSISLSSTNSSINGDGHSTTLITAKVANRLGDSVSDVYIAFNANMGSVTHSCTTDSSGRCSITYSAPNQAGIATVTGYIYSDSSISGSILIVLVPVSNLQVQFYTAPEVGNPIVPAFALNHAYLNQNMTTVYITNTGSGAFTGTLQLSIPGWSDTVSQNLNVQPGSTVSFGMSPNLNNQAFSNLQAQSINYQLAIANSDGQTVYQKSYSANITSYNTMDWMGGSYTNLIAAWVQSTANNVHVLLSDAATSLPNQEMVGYIATYSSGCGFLGLSSCNASQSTNLQLQAIYNQLQSENMHYVNAPNDFAGSQTVYTPIQSLTSGGMNCIDGTLVFASATVSTGMETYIALVPGHAFVCVQTTASSNYVDCIETTMIGTGSSFSQAESYASTEYATYQKAGTLTLVNVNQVLSSGVKSLPSS